MQSELSLNSELCQHFKAPCYSRGHCYCRVGTRRLLFGPPKFEYLGAPRIPPPLPMWLNLTMLFIVMDQIQNKDYLMCNILIYNRIHLRFRENAPGKRRTKPKAGGGNWRFALNAIKETPGSRPTRLSRNSYIPKWKSFDCCT